MIHACSALMEEPPIPASNSSSLHEAFWLCHHIFKEKAKKSSTTKEALMLRSQRIFLFTTSDMPPIPDKSTLELEIAHAQTHARQLDEFEIELELFPIRVKELFDYSKFYSSIMKVDPEEANEYILKQCEKLSDLATRIRRREFKKRRLGRVDFRISEGVIVGTQL